MPLENLTRLVEAYTPAFYRISSYLAQTMLDDPAILAMVFC